MKTSLKWLKRYVNIDCTAQELADRITSAGIEVAGIEYGGANLQNIVVGKITAIGKHPDADKLQICTVDVGREQLQIVTGARNVQSGDTVPVALVGAKLPDGLEIKPAKLRGVDSRGMLCSAAELSIDAKLLLPEERDGIFQLDTSLIPGTAIAEALGMDDAILEFEPTPNRADCFSVVGIAREAAVACKTKLNQPDCECVPRNAELSSNRVSTRIADSALSGRFSAKVMTDVKVSASPEWLKQALRSAGVRPINNVVDVTNFVMLELGQPLHAYDSDKLSGRQLNVRRAVEGEKLVTLDEVERILTSDMIVIADEQGTVGLAGIMGGLATEVSGTTKTIVLEAAAFDAKMIRRTAKALGLRSEASGRFERGVDVARTNAALERAAQLLQDIGAASALTGIADCYPAEKPAAVIEFTAAAINKILGTAIAKEIMLEILNSLGIYTEVIGENLKSVAPSWRRDIQIVADIAEEVGRIYGYDNIPLKMPCEEITHGGQLYLQSIADRVRNILAAGSMDETINFSFIHPDSYNKLNLPVDSHLRQSIPILNPIVAEFPEMRTTLIDSLLTTVKYNLSHKNCDMRIYEIASVYLPEALPLKSLPAEKMQVCGALCGRMAPVSWYSGKEAVDFYAAKGMVEEVLADLHIFNCEYLSCDNPVYHPGKSCTVMHDGTVLGYIGELHPVVTQNYDIAEQLYMFELDLNLLAEKACLNQKFSPLPKFQSVKRDLALVLPVDIPVAAVQQEISFAAGGLFFGARLFDQYCGERMPSGKKSVGFSLYFCAEDRTLTDSEVEAELEQIVKSLTNKFAAEIRMA